MIPPKFSFTAAVFVFASLTSLLIVASTSWGQSPKVDCPSLARSLPPEGLPIPSDKAALWITQADAIATKIDSHTIPSNVPWKPDVEVLLKACRMAIEYRELYAERDFAKVERLLELAEQRAAMLNRPTVDWVTGAGRQVRGFRSKVDGSVQPIGLVLPDDWQLAKQPLPLYVWLHGRGDKTTDLHFICDRLDHNGEITPENALVLHPFGRQCIGYKSAGETDVLEAIEFVCTHYPVDRQRIVLMGFSMGGAGVWHLAAHYSDRFVAASPGAGFAETSRYQNLRPEQYPASYVQTLWSIYDVPGYTCNLFNLPIVAYSGELDKQIQAARVMEEAFANEGRVLDHIIGPGMGHKYDADSLQNILNKMDQAVQIGQPKSPKTFYIQSKHPRYAGHRWLNIDGAAEEYQDTRATAKLPDSGSVWQIETHNATRLKIATTDHLEIPVSRVLVDGDMLQLDPTEESLLRRSPDDAANWELVERFDPLRKHPGVSGPIDDAFIDPFMVVLPSLKLPVADPARAVPAVSRVEQWIQCELSQFEQRWGTVFRGSLRIKQADAVTLKDMQDYHLILWGSPSSNLLLKRLFETPEANGSAKNSDAATLGQAQLDAIAVTEGRLNKSFEIPMTWNEASLGVGENQYSVDDHVLVAVYPNPWSPSKYVVINSGPTFRTAHDRSNSLQNPQLPDWAVIALDELPSAERPGRISAAGFFDGSWQPR